MTRAAAHLTLASQRGMPAWLLIRFVVGRLNPTEPNKVVLTPNLLMRSFARPLARSLPARTPQVIAAVLKTTTGVLLSYELLHFRRRHSSYLFFYFRCRSWKPLPGGAVFAPAGFPPAAAAAAAPSPPLGLYWLLSRCFCAHFVRFSVRCCRCCRRHRRRCRRCCCGTASAAKVAVRCSEGTGLHLLLLLNYTRRTELPGVSFSGAAR